MKCNLKAFLIVAKHVDVPFECHRLLNIYQRKFLQSNKFSLSLSFSLHLNVIGHENISLSKHKKILSKCFYIV